jgi:MgtC family
VLAPADREQRLSGARWLAIASQGLATNRERTTSPRPRRPRPKRYTSRMFAEFPPWPYVPTLARLALALAIGLFVGIERERRQKEAGVRTFAFAAMLGAVGGLLGEVFALLALGLLGILVVLLNVEAIRTGEGAEITTSAALLVTAFAGLLAGQGHTFTPTLLGIATAALLAWKHPLAGFSRAH